MSRLSKFVNRNVLRSKKTLWGIVNNHSPDATPVFVFGAQRSGTTMLMDCFDRSMEIEVFGEDSKAMMNYRIRPNGEIEDLIRASRHRHIVFKPLTDSHRVGELLSLSEGAKAIWVFRRVEDRVNSSVAKFGDHNLQILTEFSKGAGRDRWQAQGLSAADFDWICSFDYSSMSPYAASALFWYLRNSLFFSQNLECNDLVLPLAYEDLASNPRETMQKICAFIGATYRPAMVEQIHARSIGRREPKIPPEIMEICVPVYERLYALQQQAFADLSIPV